MPKIKFLEETPEQEERKARIIESLKRDGFWRREVKRNSIRKTSPVDQNLAISFNWREKALLVARLDRIASKAGMSRNGWLVWQIKELVEAHDYENI